ncbi:S8 family serine peptidase [uncultured Flavobacterium sp.]|uniref:S8 family serine peptidase n=1 Tax=uncultured Flavobacterium sp. TaxID=165435 RepID=UPI0030C7E3DD
MKKLVLIFILSIAFNSIAQEDAWVYFTNKPNSATFLANPLSMLSQRALDRRTAQNIPLDITDVPVHQPYIDQIAAATGITFMAKSKWLNAVHVRGTQTDIQALSTLSFVNSIDFANKALNTRQAQPYDSKINKVNKEFEEQVFYNYGGSSNQVQMLNGHLLHQQDYTGQNKIIAVLDSGFIGVDTAAPFQNLVTNGQILGGYNFPDRNTNYFSRHNHGTSVLSCMGGFADNQLVGTAPNAQYYLFITEDINEENPVEESYWVEAAEVADSLGVDIINSSLGYFTYDNPAYSYSYSDMNGTTAFASRGADIAFAKGMMVVISAGNSGNSANPHVGVPAEAINVLAVGAVDSNEAIASFSSVGPSFDGRIKPDVCAKGQLTTVSTTTGNIVVGSGTSYASPVLAGMVATFWSAVPSLTNIQLKQFIIESADLFANPTIYKGYGVPDFQLALTNALNATDFPIENPILYPNPVVSQITLASQIKNGNLLLFNSLGQLVKEETINKKIQNFDLESLQSGIYYYQITSPTINLKGKIIKQ